MLFSSGLEYFWQYHQTLCVKQISTISHYSKEKLCRIQCVHLIQFKRRTEKETEKMIIWQNFEKEQKISQGYLNQ